MQGQARFPTGIRWVLVGALGVLLLPVTVRAQSSDAVTYAKDVAPIIQQNCQTCHRPGSVAPMSLLTYEDAQQWAPLIREKVTTRQMPPWPIDTEVGIQAFKNDRSLSREEIATIAEWVDTGASLGDPADLPEPIAWPAWDERWEYEDFFGRQPDVVFSSPPYTVVADGTDQWPGMVIEMTREMGIAGDRWIRAVEIRPADAEARYVFHHANARPRNRRPEDVQRTQVVRQRNASQSSQRDYIANSAIGTQGEIFPEGTGRLIKEGDLIGFDMHFYPIDRDVEASMQVGLWLYPEGETPYPTEGWLQFQYSRLAGMEDNVLLVPPHSQVMYRGSFQLDGNAKLYGLRGHMHLRGKYQMVEVIYPDGRYELLNKLNWHHAWHTQFLYEEDAMPLLPKGTTVILTSVFDNTASNPHNPDPDQWLVEGSRTADEMHNMRLGITFVSDEEFQRLLAEKERIVSGNPAEAEILAMDQKVADAVVSGDVAYVESILAPDFSMVHGDHWTRGGEPLLSDDKQSFLRRVANKSYAVIQFDSVRAEMHGDVAITYGRYVASTRAAAGTDRAWFYVWYERVFAERDGRWMYLSHRTVYGPIFGPTRESLSDA